MSFEDQNGAGTPVAEASPVVETPAAVETVAAPAVTEAPARTMEETAGEVWERLNPPRDNGKFTAKAPDKVEPGDTPSDPATVEEPAATPTSEAQGMPQSWAKEQTEVWAKLDPVARDYILKREADVAKGFREYGEKYKPLEEVDRLLDPYKAKLEAEGLSPVQGIQRLLRAQDIMERNPIEGLNWLARSYGVNLGQLTQQPNGQEQTTQPPIDPRVEPLQQRLDRLESEAQTRAKQEAETFQQSLEADVAKFRANPEHPYFDEIKADMAGLLQAGTAADLNDAYEKAVWANPATRSKVLEDQRKAETAKAVEAAAKAKQAGSLNVRSTPANAAPPKNMDETLARTYDAIQARG